MIEEYIESLRRTGMKITPQRLVILRKLIELRDEHPSLNKLYRLVREELPTISFSTLYSVVKRLESIGLVKLFDLAGETRIEVNRRPHINIVDIEGGVIRDYMDEELLDRISERIGVGYDDIYLVNIYVYRRGRG